MSKRYEDPLPISRAKVQTALRSPDDRVTALALIRMGLHEKDWKWAEGICLSALSDYRKSVRTASLTALGHLARIHRKLHLEIVVPAVRKLMDDPDCSGVAEHTLEDINMFVSRTVSQSI